MRKPIFIAIAIGLAGVALGAWTQAQTRVSSGTLTPQDFIEIQQLYAALARGLDSADANGYAFARNFVADGVQGNLVGQKALADFAVNWHEKRNGMNVRHSMSNLIVMPTAEGANASAYLLMLNVGNRPVTVFGTASENDVLVKTPEGWRFKTRAIHADAAAAQ